MTPMFQVCQDRVAQNYADEVGVDPKALPPGTIATIINILLPILLQFLGKCQGSGSPPTTGAKAIIEHCQNGTVRARFQIRRQIILNGGLDQGMRMSAVVNTILKTGAGSTPEEIQAFAEEMQE